MGKLRVTILGGNNADCTERCGADWSSPEVLKLAQKTIKEKFGAGVELSYIELPGSQDSPSAEESGQAPVAYPEAGLVVNGKRRISGYFDMRQLMDVIETEMEVNREQ